VSFDGRFICLFLCRVVLERIYVDLALLFLFGLVFVLFVLESLALSFRERLQRPLSIYRVVVFSIRVFQLVLQVLCLSLQYFNIPLLIPALLCKVRSSHEVLEMDFVLLSVKVALLFKSVNSIKAIIAPTLAHFKI